MKTPAEHRYPVHVVPVSARGTTNYFSSTSYDPPLQRRRSYFLFNDTDEGAIKLAHFRALQAGGRVALWRRAYLRGPWDTVRLVGDSPEDGDDAPESDDSPAPTTSNGAPK